MKKLVGTFRTEEEAILALNDLKDMGLDPKEITIMTNEPVEFKKITRTFGQGAQGMVAVGDIAHGPAVHSFFANLNHYGFTMEKATKYQNDLHLGNVLVFIGVNEEINRHLKNPGTYRAKDLHIHDIETPGTYTLSTKPKETPDTPGKYVSEEYGENLETPGTYQNPYPDAEKLTPGSITEDDQLTPHHNMVKNPDSE